MRVGRCGGGAAVGETQQRPFQLSFNGSLRVEFQGARVTSDGGLILVRELDERLGLSALMGRAGLVENNRHAAVNRLKRSIGGRRDTGERRLPLTGLGLPCFEESGEEEQGVICRMDPQRLAPGLGTAPFVKSGGRHDAAPLLKRLAERRKL